MVDSRGLAKAARETALEVASYWRRALLTFLAGFAVLLALHDPLVEQSVIGQLDRSMTTTAFNLRADVFVGRGDPVLLMDIDNATIAAYQAEALIPGREPSASASRGLLADLLGYVLAAPPGRGPKVVMLDVDLAAPTAAEPDGVARLHKVLADWAADPRAPPLIVSRESFAPDLLGGVGQVRGLPTSVYDDVVDTAPNIYWGEAKVLTDANGSALEVLPYECVRDHGRIQPLFSTALLSYGTLVNGHISPTAPVRKWMNEAADACRTHPDRVISHGEPINYHLSMSRDDDHHIWPTLPPTWRGYRTCGRTSDASVFRRLSAGVIQQAGADASTDILCGRLVVIGGTNSVAKRLSPDAARPDAGVDDPGQQRAGPANLGGGPAAGAAGHADADACGDQPGNLHQLHLFRRAREFYRARRGARSGWMQEIALLPLNPVVLNFGVALLAHIMGIGLMLLALHLGHWGFLSGPAFGSALAETIQDFTDEEA